MPSASITIRTGSRLHFGPLSYLPETGRHFGGIGLMIDRPGFTLTATTPPPSRRFGIHFPRAEAVLESILRQNPEFQLPIQIDLAEGIPSHAGLGSGTQLSLAIMEAVAALHHVSIPPQGLAEKSRRGDRSAIGIYGYEQGGFLVDAGHAGKGSLGELASRLDFPAKWRILLLHPHDAQGLHGSVEMRAFQQLGSMPDTTSGQLCRLTLTQMLPACRLQNFSEFAAALYEYGQLVGEFFGSTQGGTFASPCMRQLREEFTGVELTGMAQSSWGPTVAMFAENDEIASELLQRIRKVLPASACDIEITKPRNTGRTLTRE